MEDRSIQAQFCNKPRCIESVTSNRRFLFDMTLLATRISQEVQVRFVSIAGSNPMDPFMGRKSSTKHYLVDVYIFFCTNHFV